MKRISFILCLDPLFSHGIPSLLNNLLVYLFKRHADGVGADDISDIFSASLSPEISMKVGTIIAKNQAISDWKSARFSCKPL